jgi:hypothetical protein
MFTGSTFEIIQGDLQSVMNNPNNLWSISYVAYHIESQVTPMGSNMLEDFELNKEDNSKALLITKSFTWSLDTMFAHMCMVCNLNNLGVILQVQSFSIYQFPSFGFVSHNMNMIYNFL